jgi:hypothetical protein
MTRMRDTKAWDWAAIIEPDDVGGVVRAIKLFEETGVLSPDEAREWRRAILDRKGLPVAGCEA